MDMQQAMTRQAAALLQILRAKGLRAAFAESCTGGLLAAAFTACPGASAALEQSYITYADSAKQQLLGVPWALLRQYTAVSAPVAQFMAAGARRRAGADLGLAVTGLAGPDSDQLGQPVGLVYVAGAFAQRVEVRRCLLPGDRQLVRQQAVLAALRLGREMLQADKSL